MFEKFLRRPTLATVISLIIVLLGLLSISTLPMAQFPSVAPPRVLVSLTYPGANAAVLTDSVLIPLEQAINGVKNMRYIVSDATSAGEATIQVYFEPGTSINAAVVNVQTRVNLMRSRLPELVQREGILISQEMPAMLMYVNLFSTDKQADEEFLFNFASVNVVPVIKRTPGVGRAKILGSRRFAMRIWLNPQRMRAYDVSAEDIMEAMKEQSVIGVPGRLGQATGRVSQSIEYSLRYQERFNDPKQYEDIIVRAKPNGEVLHLKDVAEVELGSEFYDIYSNLNGNPSAAIVIKQNLGTNAQEVIGEIKAKLEELKREQFPPGMDYAISYDVSSFIDASISKVIHTLFEAFVLVSLVVFVFLGDIRSTLIPVLAVPVALIGAFFWMRMLGLSINMITLFAIVLSIGIVVDNAIVVVEAVHAKMQKQHLSPFRAAQEVVKEISGAIIAITLVMTAVFVPVCFMTGPIGVFYRQFGITMAAAIILSGVVALTLTPVLCAMILKPHKSPDDRPSRLARMQWAIYGPVDRATGGRASRLWARVPVRLCSALIALAIGAGTYYLLRERLDLELSSALVLAVIAGFGLNELLGILFVIDTGKPGLLRVLVSGFDRLVDRSTAAYTSVLRRIVPWRLATILVIGGFCYAVYYVGSKLPTGFIPNEDQGMIYMILQTPPGSTLEYTNAKSNELQAIAEKIEGVETVSALAGYEVLTEGRGSNAGTCLINLKKWSDRKMTSVEIIEELEKKCSAVGNCKIEFYQPPAVPGFGTAGGISLRMLDKTASYDYQALGKINDKFMDALSKRKELTKLFTFFASDYPQYEIIIDNQAAMQKGVSIGKAMDNLAVLIASTYDQGFVRFGKFYKVYVQALPEFRRLPDDLNNLYIKNDRGEEVPYSSFLHLELKQGLNEITRYNLYPSAAIQVSAAPGFSVGQAMEAVNQVAQETLPHGYGIGWEGLAFEEAKQGNTAIYILLVVIGFVFLLLAAQYESYLLPLSVLLSLPIGIFGALWFLQLAGLSNNVYSQMGLVMLVGLLGKNAILVVEYAVQRRDEGFSLIDAAVEGGKLRVRAILMTSFAFVAGMLPLVYATGPGANGNHNIGIVAAGGMFVGTTIGIFIIPGLCYLFAKLSDGRHLVRDEAEEPASETVERADD